MRPIFKRIAQERRKTQWWIMYHLFCVFLFTISLYCQYKFMTTPDYVVVRDRAGGYSYAYTCNSKNDKVITNMALRGVFLFLNRSFETDIEEKVPLYYEKKGKAKIKHFLSLESKDFREKEIYQNAEVKRLRLTTYKGYPMVVIKGYLHRNMRFEKEVRFQKKLKFAVACILGKNPELKAFPYKIINIKYKLWSI